MKRSNHGPFEYTCAVPTGGFRWRDDLEGVGITPWLVGSTDEPSRLYQPLAVAGLHRQFAGVRPTKTGIKRFADKYGDITCGDPLTSPGGGAVIVGESIGTWSFEIQRMRNLTPCKGKQGAIVIEFIDDHHPILLQHSMARVAIYEAERGFNVEIERIGGGLLERRA